MRQEHYPRPRANWRGPLLLGLIVVGLVALAILFAQLRAALDPDLRAAAAAERWRQEAIDSQLTWLDTLVAAGWRLLPLAALSGLTVVGLLVLYRRWAVPAMIQADKVIALQVAAAQRFPAGLHSLSFHDSSKMLPAPEVPLIEAAPAQLPGALDLAALDMRPTKDRILLGIDEAGPVTVSVPDLCHVALLGSTGGGKSNLLRLIVPQLQAIGASVVLADPHFAPVDPESGEDWRPIAARLMFAPAVKAAEIDHALDYMTEELERRLERRNRGERFGPPLFLAFDELPVICDLVKDAPARLGRLLREGRKVHLLTVGASQSMLIKEIGGSSALRDQYRTCYYVGGDRKSASAMLDMPERTIDDGPLGMGVVLLRSKATAPAHLVRVPMVSNEALYTMLGGETTDESATFDRPAFGFQPPRKTDPAKVERKLDESPSESPESQSPDRARILALFRDGLSVAEIVKRISGATSGSRYNAVRAEVEAVLRQVVAERA